MRSAAFRLRRLFVLVVAIFFLFFLFLLALPVVLVSGVVVVCPDPTFCRPVARMHSSTASVTISAMMGRTRDSSMNVPTSASTPATTNTAPNSMFSFLNVPTFLENRPLPMNSAPSTNANTAIATTY